MSSSGDTGLDDESAPTLFTTEPTTFAGTAALMTYVIELIDGCNGPDDWNDNRPLLW